MSALFEARIQSVCWAERIPARRKMAQTAGKLEPASHLALCIPALRRISLKPSKQFQIHFVHSGPFSDDAIAGIAFQNVVLLPSAPKAAASSQRLLAVRMNVGWVRAH